MLLYRVIMLDPNEKNIPNHLRNCISTVLYVIHSPYITKFEEQVFLGGSGWIRKIVFQGHF